jgi:hypothetical protein
MAYQQQPMQQIVAVPAAGIDKIIDKKLIIS